MDYGRYKYEQNVKKKENAKKQRESQIQVKELRLRPSIADNDIDTKINQAKKFLEDGFKVQFNLQFRGQREMSHKEQGYAVMRRVTAILEAIAVIEKPPLLEGNKITCFFSPKP
jgi:translation initiation factor IF-3